MVCFYVRAGLFVIVVLGAIAYFGGFSIFRYFGYIRVELLRSNLLKSKSVADYLEHTVPASAPAARAKALKYFP